MVPQSLFPQPVATLQAVFSIILSADVWDLFTTLYRTMIAFFMTLFAAVFIAIAAQYNRLTKEVVKDLMSFIIRIPTIAYITFYVLLLGAGLLTIYLAVVTAVIPVATLSIISLYDKISPDMHTINRVYRVPFVKQAFFLYIPYLFHSFHSIFLLSYSMTFKALIMTEFFAGLSGLGYGLMIQRETLDIERLTAYIMIIALVGFASQKGLEWCSRGYMRWYATT